MDISSTETTQSGTTHKTTLVPGVGRLPYPAYRGKEPYIFVSYAHADSEKVFEEIKRFNEAGFHVWYDEGIAPGSEWADSIADALANCSVYVVMITPTSATRGNVVDEIFYALSEKKPFIAIHLEKTTLSGGVKMRIGAKQAIYRYNMSEEEYYFRFVEAFENFGLERHIAEPLSPAASAASREDKQAEPKAASKQTNYADIANAQAGSHIYFGSYEQDNDLYASVKPIEWRVLERKGNRILVISEYGLEDEPYNKKRASVTWETCTLRAWLNSDFLTSAFTADEQAMIPAVHVVNEKNPKFGTDGGNDTEDKVFILSISEAKSFFPTKNDRMCTPTAYTLAKGCYANKDSGRCWWWLRSPGDDQGHVARMDIDGTLLYDGYFAARTTGAVRPALWIEI
jgi:hypothetical protein